MVDRSGVAALARRHPLTVEGEEIGSFDLVVACVAGGDGYNVSYMERRHDAEQSRYPMHWMPSVCGWVAILPR